MLALETTATLADHRFVIQDAALPALVGHARVIVLWESTGWSPITTASAVWYEYKTPIPYP